MIRPINPPDEIMARIAQGIALATRGGSNAGGTGAYRAPEDDVSGARNGSR